MSDIECPRCYDGTDPRADDQSCLVCWGAMAVNLSEQSWSGQHRKLLEHILYHPNWDQVKDSLRGTIRKSYEGKSDE